MSVVNDILKQNIEKALKGFTSAIVLLKKVSSQACSQIADNENQIITLTAANTDLQESKDKADRLISKIEDLIK